MGKRKDEKARGAEVVRSDGTGTRVDDRSHSVGAPGSTSSSGGAADDLNPQIGRMLDRLLAVQRPAVLANIRLLRKRKPHATPAQIITALEREYLTGVAAGGAAIGATAVVPGIGTGTALALSGVGAAGFLEATALFAQAVTEVHGIRLDDPERARALVLTMMLGTAGTDLVAQVAGQATGRAPAMNQYWGSVITKGLPQFLVGDLTDRAKKMFIRHFAVQTGAGALGKALPFGIGAVVGGTGNAILGRGVISSARDAFGPAPTSFTENLVIAATRGERKHALRAGTHPGAYEPQVLHVRDYGGDGEKTALLLHDVRGDSRVWYEFAPWLIGRGFRVIAPDLTGHGGSPRSRVYSPERWAADVRASVLHTPDLVVGVGLGALVGSLLADEYLPERTIHLDPTFADAGGLPIPFARDASARTSAPRRSQIEKKHPRWTAEQIDLDLTNLERWDPETLHGIRDKAMVRAPEVPIVPSLVVLPQKNSNVGSALAKRLGAAGFDVRAVPGSGDELLRENRSALETALVGWV